MLYYSDLLITVIANTTDECDKAKEKLELFLSELELRGAIRAFTVDYDEGEEE